MTMNFDSTSVWWSSNVFLLFSVGGHLQLLGNQSNEHLPRTPGNPLKFSWFPAAWTFIAVWSIAFKKLSRPYTGCHWYRQDHLLAEATDPGPTGSHGQPHQLRPLPSLQQLHLCVSISEHSCLEQRSKSFCFCVVCAEERRQVGRR